MELWASMQSGEADGGDEVSCVDTPSASIQLTL